jgi:small subunit ribosomal protein S19
MARIIVFRGKNTEELKSIKNDDYAKMLRSRQRRSLKRMGVTYKELVAKVESYRKKGINKVIKTHVREAVILPSWLGLKFGVYNGKEFREVEITGEMLGHRLGEFSPATKTVMHSAPGIRATRGSKFLSVKG